MRQAVAAPKGGNTWFYLTTASRDYGLTSGTRDTPKIQIEELGREIVYAPNAEAELALKKRAFLQIERGFFAVIINDLIEADLVIADLTEHNPNVLFELGVRMVQDKPVLHKHPARKGEGIAGSPKARLPSTSAGAR
ncbi:MAG: hypothetical protein JST93_05365 [Acidobacteria bacterium]|nr:hypothetical protein [Acidobacteriota bacterium]